jgi:hypothetical protein
VAAGTGWPSACAGARASFHLPPLRPPTRRHGQPFPTYSRRRSQSRTNAGNPCRHGSSSGTDSSCHPHRCRNCNAGRTRCVFAHSGCRRWMVPGRAALVAVRGWGTTVISGCPVGLWPPRQRARGLLVCELVARPSRGPRRIPMEAPSVLTVNSRSRSQPAAGDWRTTTVTRTRLIRCAPAALWVVAAADVATTGRLSPANSRFVPRRGPAGWLTDPIRGFAMRDRSVIAGCPYARLRVTAPPGPLRFGSRR